MKVFCPTSKGGHKHYHTDLDNCFAAQRMLDDDQGRWMDKELIESWGWEECSRCNETYRKPGSTGEQLADKLKKMGEQRYPNKGDC